jgi:hypothetical protein
VLGTRVRLPVLLVILGLVTWQLVERKTGASAGGQVKDCVLPIYTDTSMVSEKTQVQMFSGDLFVGDVEEASGGVQRTIAMWTGAAPSPPSAWPAHGPFPGGWEESWWSSRHEYLTTDEFVFDDTADAQRFVDVASDNRCRDHASTPRAADRPSGARELTWRNRGKLEADVYFARGVRVYRAAYIPAGPDATDVPRIGEWIQPQAEKLACRLQEADCPPTPK